MMAENAAERQFCTFYAGETCYGIIVDRVRETVTDTDITPVPLSETQISGILNLRGDIVTVINLRARLGLPPSEDDSQKVMHVIVDATDGRVSLLVDRVGDVLTVPNSTFEEPPTTMDERSREFILGAHKLEEGLLLVLDVDKTVAV